MGLPEIKRRFSTQARCIKHLEKLRWQGKVKCAHCGSDRSFSQRQGTYIYHCNTCNQDFTVLVGTIFEHSRMELPTWFMIISLMLDARQGISSAQISRNLEITYQSAWYAAMRIRSAMIEDIQLEGIVEADEVYAGGKPRQRYKNSNTVTSISQLSKDPNTLGISNAKRGRGTSKAKIAGMVERKGRVVLQLMDTFNTVTLLSMLKKNVRTDRTVVMTDEARFYNRFEDYVDHFVIKHKERYVDGDIHTNTIEGFWSILKAGMKGNYRVLSKKYLPFYLAEFAYRYNRRNKPKLIFDEFLTDALSEGKCMEYRKPLKEPKIIAYKPTTGQRKLAKFNEMNKLARNIAKGHGKKRVNKSGVVTSKRKRAGA